MFKISSKYLDVHEVEQSLTCLATDEIISTVILLPSIDSFKKGHCQLQAKVCARITG